VEKARAKKAQPDSKVGVLSQLEISEGDKKKRKCSDSRISIPVKMSGPSPVVADQAANAEEEAKSPVKKKSRTLSRKTKRDKDVVEVDKELHGVDDAVVETSPVVEENADTVARQTDGNSPWDPMFNPELFFALQHHFYRRVAEDGAWP
jgi:hypothetical protein